GVPPGRDALRRVSTMPRSYPTSTPVMVAGLQVQEVPGMDTESGTEDRFVERDVVLRRRDAQRRVGRIVGREPMAQGQVENDLDRRHLAGLDDLLCPPVTKKGAFAVGGALSDLGDRDVLKLAPPQRRGDPFVVLHANLADKVAVFLVEKEGHDHAVVNDDHARPSSIHFLMVVWPTAVPRVSSRKRSVCARISSSVWRWLLMTTSTGVPSGASTSTVILPPRTVAVVLMASIGALVWLFNATDGTPGFPARPYPTSTPA